MRDVVPFHSRHSQSRTPLFRDSVSEPCSAKNTSIWRYFIQLMFGRNCALCSSGSDSDKRTARAAAKVGARVGAAAGSRAGPVGAGLGSGLGGATGFIAGAVIDDIESRFDREEALPDGGRPRPAGTAQAEPNRVEIPVTESDE